MSLTPKEKRRAQLQKERLAQRRKKVLEIKLAIAGGTGFAVLLIAAFMIKGTYSRDTASLHNAPTVQAALKSEPHAETETSRPAVKEQEPLQDDPAKMPATDSGESELSLEESPSDAKAYIANTQEDIPAASSLDSPYAQALVDLARQEPRMIDMLQNLSDYPEALQKMAVENQETLDFVLDYPEKKDTAAAESIGKVTKGTIPLLLQWDSRWGYSSYGNSIIGASGCGPTCIAMIAAGLTGRSDITPASVAAYSMEGGFLTAQADTKWDLMSYGCEEFGVTGTVLSLEETAMKRSLEAGSPIICSMRPGDFTNGGHFIVLTGYQDGMFQVHDPNSKVRSEQLWSFETLQWQIKNLWSYSLCK